MPRAKLGQHWLTDKNICRKIAEAVELQTGDTCVEIGGGKGAITRYIAPKCRRLIVYEIDSKWSAHIRNFNDDWGGNLEVRELDALKIEWDRERLEINPDEPLVIAGNLPYYLTSPLLLRLAYSGLDIQRAVFLVQKELAERIAANPSDSEYSRLTVSLGAFLETKILFTVKPDAFKPQPKVISALIQMTRRKKPLVDDNLVDSFERTVQIAFHMRRKTLKNNLRDGFPDVPVVEIEKILEHLGVRPDVRAQDVGVEDFVTLTGMMNSTERT